MENKEQVLGLLHNKLLALHKTLVDMERESYERIHGPVQSVAFLNLLMQDLDYSWLRKISELIVWIDEVLDPKEHTVDIEPEKIIEQSRKLLNPVELGDDFERKYQDALQRNPDVIMAHQEVRNLLKQVG